ncbi:MAG: ester cyclase [Bacteroidetes bacterium]|nr:ester cyclase [Bacteroidota bacterium]MBL6964814.1 ester cyclase [Bacteroidota bacterium]
MNLRDLFFVLSFVFLFSIFSTGQDQEIIVVQGVAKVGLPEYFLFSNKKPYQYFETTADEYVVAQLKYTGTHSSKFMELDSTGNKIEYKGIFIFKIADGKIAELWGMEDDLTMMTQLGLELK